MIMSQHIGNLSRNTKTIKKKNKMKILKLKSSVTNINNSVGWINRRYEIAENIISEIEARLVEVI